MDWKTWLIVIVLILIATLFKIYSGSPELINKIKSSSNKIGSYKNKLKRATSIILVIIGVALANYIAYVLSSDFWKSLWDNQQHFWTVNGLLVLAVSLRLIKKKDDKDKEMVQPVAKRISTVLIFVSIIIATLHLNINQHKGVELNITERIAIPSERLPWEIIAPIISGCESGNGTPGSGRQFDDEGNLIKNPNSSAVGKYQILASKHEERAKSLGFDIKTLQGNENYAKYLYNESGTEDWEIDPKSVACWRPKLANLGFYQEEIPVFVEAPIGAFSKETPIPLGFKVSWGESKDPFVVINDRGISAKYDPQNGIFEDIPPPSKSLRFKSLSQETAEVKLKYVKL
ncbi:MAG: hypothetical protein JW740_01445 [Candidatus Zambryskibacteria bacterium]|nr:hypothetical protein [Candidatus Zambryskibacteria bacterium]